MEPTAENVARVRELAQLWLGVVGDGLGQKSPDETSQAFAQAVAESAKMPGKNYGDAIVSLVFALQTTSLALKSLIDMVGTEDKDVSDRISGEIRQSFDKAVETAMPR